MTQKPSKKAEKSFYKAFYSKDEYKHSKHIKVGSLEDEIKISKVVLRRYLCDYSTDAKYIKGLMEILNTIRGLERDHKEICAITENPRSLVDEMILASQELDDSVVPDGQ